MAKSVHEEMSPRPILYFNVISYRKNPETRPRHLTGNALYHTYKAVNHYTRSCLDWDQITQKQLTSVLCLIRFSHENGRLIQWNIKLLNIKYRLVPS
ncbi:hypothetical protein PO124_04820 [Bacillus licheniformis]|nr:hypothetical protein [Bacillus licheniformis]